MCWSKTERTTERVVDTTKPAHRLGVLYNLGIGMAGSPGMVDSAIFRILERLLLGF
jgi:hypothetical protein